MKAVIVTFIICFNITACLGQTRIRFNLESKYEIDGVIFSKAYTPHFSIANISTRYTPSIDNIKLCEKYLLLNQKGVNYIELRDFYTPNSLKYKLRDYKRQYVGFINNEKDSVILVQLLNFKNKRKAIKMFEDWESNFVLGFDTFYEDNTVRFKVNLTKKEVSIY